MYTDFSRADFSSVVPGVGQENITEEERRRRLAMLGVSDTTMPDKPFNEAVVDYVGDRVNTAQDNIAQELNPVVPMDMRTTMDGVNGMAGINSMNVDGMELALNQRRRRPEARPVDPNQQVDQQAVPVNNQSSGFTPQTQQSTLVQPNVQTELKPNQMMPTSWTEKVSSIANDQDGLINYLNNAENPAEGKQWAKNRLQQMWSESQNAKAAEQKVNDAVTSGDLLPIMKEIKKQTGEGSLMKAYLYGRLGLNDLAKQEQQKLGADTSYMPAIGPRGERAIIQYGANGLPLKGFNEKGQQISAEELSMFASSGIGPTTKSHLLPSVHGTPVQRTNQSGQVETGLMMYDPRTQTSYVQVGNTRLPTTGWTTMSQTPSSIYTAAGAKKQGDISAETGVQQPPLPNMNIPQVQPAPVQTSPVQTAPVPQVQTGPVSPDQAVPQARPAPNRAVTTTTTQQPAADAQRTTVVATSTPTGGVKLNTGGGTRMAGNVPVVTQREGESYASFKQREKLAQEQAEANIQAGKEITVKREGAKIETQKELNLAEEKPTAQAKGEEKAKPTKRYGNAIEVYGVAKEINEQLPRATGSAIGAKVDDVAAFFGYSTEGAQATAKLQVLADKILKNVPRFEGPQSDRDVDAYKEAAGKLADPNTPNETRAAAFKTILEINAKYAPDLDWTFGKSETGTTSSGNKYKKVK